jgi:hypothetical protein
VGSSDPLSLGSQVETVAGGFSAPWRCFGLPKPVHPPHLCNQFSQSRSLAPVSCQSDGHDRTRVTRDWMQMPGYSSRVCEIRSAAACCGNVGPCRAVRAVPTTTRGSPDTLIFARLIRETEAETCSCTPAGAAGGPRPGLGSSFSPARRESRITCPDGFRPSIRATAVPYQQRAAATQFNPPCLVPTRSHSHSTPSPTRRARNAPQTAPRNLSFEARRVTGQARNPPRALRQGLRQQRLFVRPEACAGASDGRGRCAGLRTSDGQVVPELGLRDGGLAMPRTSQDDGREGACSLSHSPRRPPVPSHRPGPSYSPPELESRTYSSDWNSGSNSNPSSSSLQAFWPVGEPGQSSLAHYVRRVRLHLRLESSSEYRGADQSRLAVTSYPTTRCDPFHSTTGHGCGAGVPWRSSQPSRQPAAPQIPGGAHNLAIKSSAPHARRECGRRSPRHWTRARPSTSPDGPVAAMGASTDFRAGL